MVRAAAPQRMATAKRRAKPTRLLRLRSQLKRKQQRNQQSRPLLLHHQVRLPLSPLPLFCPAPLLDPSLHLFLYRRLRAAQKRDRSAIEPPSPTSSPPKPPKPSPSRSSSNSPNKRKTTSKTKSKGKTKKKGKQGSSKGKGKGKTKGSKGKAKAKSPKKAKHDAQDSKQKSLLAFFG